MTATTDTATCPPFQSGRELPFHLLAPDQFENFVFAALMCAAPTLGFRVTGKPSGTGDGGFDVQAERTNTGQIVCIQCKRQKVPLGTPQVAEELAKVAGHSFLENAAVVEHRFICTGGLRKKLQTQLRSATRQELISLTGDKLANAENAELLTLRKQLEELGHDPREIAESYVRNLESIIAWDAREFDVALSSHWDEILRIADRFFQIEKVVLEHPRAALDREAYVRNHRRVDLAVEPRLTPAALPPGIVTNSAADPGPQSAPPHKVVTDVAGLVDLEPGDLAILLGNGGAGKTEALRLIGARILQDRADSTLPIFISLTQYTPGQLDRVIHQTLGVIQGTWRSLPDQIVLLCDGLNECVASVAHSFLEELKPLLKGRQVSCIIATRDATGRSKVVLPEAIYAFVRVDSITPIGIRRLAEATLDGNDVTRFVRDYRSIADTSGSPLMWTPFAVRAALRLWEENNELPASLGEMLDALLQLRCLRNTEQDRDQLDSEVILLFAGALAFKRLVEDSKLECPGTEAGDWIQAARTRCRGALGIADVREQEIIDLLISHDLLRKTEAGYYGFEHQLTAGALAAPLLAKEWRQHVRSLTDQVADDAWVFAARLVPQDDLPDYLNTVLDADLILGARAARDLTSESRGHVLTMLRRCVAANAPETLRNRGVFALAALGSTEAIALLRIMAKDRGNDVHYAARVALATTGDEEFLKELIELVEALAATSLRVSGGDTAVWGGAPLARRLDIARQRLAERAPGDYVGLSLMLISLERDKSDEPLIAHHLSAAKDFGAWGKALHALNTVSPDRAEAIVQHEILGDYSPSSRAKLFRMAFLAGVSIDVQAACQCAMSADTSDESQAIDDHYISQLIADVLAKLSIPQSVIETVARDLPYATGSRLQHLWEIAPLCESVLIANHAAQCIETWAPEAYAACNYFSQQIDLARDRQNSLIAACEAGLDNEEIWWGTRTSAALTLVAKLGFSDKAKTHLSLIMERFRRIRRAIEGDDVDSLIQEEKAILSESLSSNYLLGLSMIVDSFLPIIAQVQADLSHESLADLLRFEFYSASAPEDLRKALLNCSDADIDAVLMEISDPMTLAKDLVAVCPRGATKTRTQLLDHLLRTNYATPMVLTQLCQAIESCWCHAILKMVVDVVSTIPRWTDYEIQFFWDLARLVGRKVSKEDESAIEEALTIATTAHAKRLLEVWRTSASNERIGFSRLSA